MDFELISTLLLGENTYPFKMDDYWKFFGYARRDNFKRAIEDSNDYTKKLTILNKRKVWEIYFSKETFVTFANKCFFDNDQWQAVFEKYFIFTIKDKLTAVDTKNKKQCYTFLQGYQYEKTGWMYTYLLNTINLGKACKLNCFEIYSVCYYNFWAKHEASISPNMETYKSSYTNSYGIPYFNFNSLYSQVREVFIMFIDFLIEHYKSEPIKLLYLNAYKKCMRKYLDYINANIDNQAQNKKRKQHVSKDDFSNRKKPKVLSNNEEQELQRLYKKAAVLCHPDKHVGKKTAKKAEDTFKRLNNAKLQKDLIRVQEIYNDLINN